MLLLRAAAFGALAVSLACAAQSSPNSSPTPSQGAFEPPLRNLWNRGSERFHRQWLVAGPISAEVGASVDPLQLQPAAGQELTPRDSGVKWVPQTSWSDVTDVNESPSRAPETDDRPVDRFVFVAGTLTGATAGPADLSIGSERPYSVWLNGRLVHARQSAEAFSPDQDRIPVDLQAGDNRVLLRFHETSAGSSQFSLRAVPLGAALKRMDEITPSLLPANDQSLAVRTHFAAENDSAQVAVQVMAAGGDVVARQTVARGEVAKFDSDKWRDGAYEIRVSTQNAWREPQVRYLTWYKGDPIAAVRRLMTAAEGAKDDVHGDTIRMLAALAKDRLGGSIENASRASWRLVHSPLMEFEELQLEVQGRPARLRASGFVRIAYNDEIDGSTQYCRAYLPGEYSAAKQWPLIVSLHGYNPANPEYVDWWSVDQRHHSIAESKGTIVLEPHGRGNAQYLGIGDRDVMHCLDEAKRRFSVDADRVYLTGDSMGGHGTWTIVTRHPDVFAAAAPVFGGWDFRITTISTPVTIPPPATEMDAYSFERSSSFSNAENLLHVPLLVIHGDEDKAVHVANSRHAVQLLQRWGYNVRYHEMPGWAHEDLGQRATIADWLLTHRRVTSPSIIHLRSTDLAGASAYWLRVRALQNPSEVIRVVAEVLQPGLVRIDSTNVAMMTLDLPAALRGSADKLRVVWNGQAHELNSPLGSAVELGSRPGTSKLHKRARLEGPLPAVIATPFAVVVGTTSSDARMREIIQTRADALSQQWLQWQRQPLRMLKDTEVTAEHEKAYSLILFGGADANAVTRKLARQLPFEASRNGIVVDGREWKVKDSVLQVLYPSPLAADRYVYLITATSPDGMYFWKPQLVHFAFGNPLSMFDWIIQDGRRPPPGTMNASLAHVAAGVFDATWRRKDRWTMTRDYKSAVSWTLRRAPEKNFAPSPAALQAVAGRYELFPGFTVTFRPDGDRLVGKFGNEADLTLSAESDSIFVLPATGDAVEFIRDAAGNVSGASIDNQGAVMWAKRLP